MEITDDVTRRTFRAERVRAITTGIFETASTFLVLVAIRWFHAEPTAKALLIGSGSLGQLCAPLAMVVASAAGWTAQRGLSVFYGIAAALFLTAAIVPRFEVFLLAGALGSALAAAAVPLLTQIYRDNYPPELRGQLFSRTTMIRIAVSVSFSFLGGVLLNGRLHLFPLILLLFGFALAVSSRIVGKLPQAEATQVGGFRLIHGFRIALADQLFRNTLIAWFFMGFGNLMMVSLRVEYLAAERYGLHLSESAITIYTGVLPALMRLVMSPVWGRLFDRMDFFLMRALLNLSFMTSILIFYSSDTTPGLVLGALVFGFSNAGGEIAWNLWVTKFAPPHQVAQYMSVHTFATGLRGVIAPFVAFWLVQRLPIAAVAMISGVLILVSVVMLLPEWRRRKRSQKAPRVASG